MSNIRKAALMFGMLVLTVCITLAGRCVQDLRTTPDRKVSNPPEMIEVQTPAAAAMDEPYILRLMDACGARISEATRKVRASQLLTVGEQMVPTPAYRRWFYYMVCVESGFNQAAKSPVGAVGLTQVMPKFAQEFAEKCGLGKLGPKDLEDSHINLMVGACQFNALMEYYEGDPALALAAYNSGKDSSTVRKAKAGDIRTGHAETQGYLAAAFVLNERMKKSAEDKESSDVLPSRP